MYAHLSLSHDLTKRKMPKPKRRVHSRSISDALRSVNNGTLLPLGISLRNQEPLLSALANFQTLLTTEESQKFVHLIQTSPIDADALQHAIVQAENIQVAKLSNKISIRILPFLKCVQSFAGVVDTFIQSNPRVSALVWGGVKLLLMVWIPYRVITAGRSC